MKTTALPVAGPKDDTEEVIVLQGPPGARKTKRMTAQQFVDGAVRPTTAELSAAILSALIEGDGVDLVETEAGVTISLKDSAVLPGAPTTTTAAPGTSSTRIATTAFVAAALEVMDAAVDQAFADAATARDAAIATAIANAKPPYNFGGHAAAAVTASEILVDHIFTRAVTLPANLAGSRVSVGTNPAAAWVATLAKNGATVGTVTISTAGAVTLATTGGAAVAFAAGDVATLTAPASADGSLARLRYTFLGA